MARTNSLLTAFPLDDAARGIVRAALDAGTEVTCLPDIPPEGRVAAIRDAGALLAWNLKDFSPAELAALSGIGLLQIMTAGVDFLPLSTLPAGVNVACNAGAYAEPMAEHALAMAMAAAKRIVLAHNEVAKGVFKQHRPNRMLAGLVCGILGYGGIGVATARLMRAVGMRVHAVNRTPRSDALLDWSGGPEQLDELLSAADVLVIATPLTKATTGLIGARELGLMKPDAILINLARGEIVEEVALYAHLLANPGFTACLDAWWVEPVRHGDFRMDHPFTDLPNVVASPHNSASVPASRSQGLQRAVANCRRALAGETPLHLVRAEDRLM
jgi:phosphoglycerate dehydrogenase-like enzyme